MLPIVRRKFHQTQRTILAGLKESVETHRDALDVSIPRRRLTSEIGGLARARAQRGRGVPSSVLRTAGESADVLGRGLIEVAWLARCRPGERHSRATDVRWCRSPLQNSGSRSDRGGVTPFVCRAWLATKSDGVLVALTRDGNDAAFSAIVDRHGRVVHRRCRMLLSADQVEDAVQVTFVRALQAMRSGTEVRELRAWLLGVARNVALSELASGGCAHEQLSEEWEDPRRSDEVDRRADLSAALSAMASLPDRQRAALVRSTAGNSHAAIAAELGVSEVAARQLLHRARATLRAAVQAVLPPPLVWFGRRIGAIANRLPCPPPSVEPYLPKLAAVAAAAAVVAAPASVLHATQAHTRYSAHAGVSIVAKPEALTTAASGPHTTFRQFSTPASPDDTPAGLNFAPRSKVGITSGHGSTIDRGPRRARATPAAGGPTATTGPNLAGANPSGSDSTATDASNQADTAADPGASDPPTTDPSSTDPTATDPTATDPTVTDPTATDPTATDPTATDPTGTDPTATDPTASDPTATDPTATTPDPTATPSQ